MISQVSSSCSYKLVKRIVGYQAVCSFDLGQFQDKATVSQRSKPASLKLLGAFARAAPKHKKHYLNYGHRSHTF
ncbi:hypothetical protein NUACC26_052240 [Scytonema sp. NUACC26]